MVKFDFSSKYSNSVLVADKKYHKGYLCGHIQRGNGTIMLTGGWALKFVADKEFTTINLIHVGIGKQMKNQTWQPVKTVVQKKTEPEKPKESDDKIHDTKKEIW